VRRHIYGRAMHRALRRHRTRMLWRRLKFVPNGLPGCEYVGGWAYCRADLTNQAGFTEAIEFTRVLFALPDLPPGVTLRP